MLPVWLILAIAVPVVLVIALLGCLDCLKYKKRFQHFKDEEDGNRVESRTNAGYFPETDSSDQSGVSSTEVQIEPLPDILVQTTTRKPRIGCVEKSKQDAAFKLITSHRSFPRRQLTYLKEIGSGWFGQIIESDAEMIILGVARSRVVVKILKDECTKSEQKIFHEDIAPFRELEHGNVLRMLGQCTETTPVLAIFEFAQMGDLKTYLKKQKLEDNKLPYHQFLKFAIDAASGMACLHRHGYVHHDFAARSCLVFSDLIVKVGDYGITEEQFPDDYYISHQEMLPVRWMAPESLSHQADIWQTAVITKEANIWCFGILLWEVLSYAAQPYTDLTDDMVLQLVVEDKVVKLCKPDLDILFLDRLYEVMQFCWLNPGQRPTIVEVHALLEHIFTKITTPQTMDSDFETRWNSIIPSEARVITVSDSRPKTRKSNSFDSDFVPLTDTAVKLPRKSVQTTSIENISIIKTPDAVSEIKDNNQLSDVINARDKMSGDAPLSEFSNSAQLGKQLPSHLTSTPVDKQTQQTLKPNLVQKDSNASSKYKSLNFNDSESVLNHLSYNTEIYPDTMESGKFVTASSSIVTVESTDTAESDYLDFGELVNADNLGEATVVKENEDTILLNNCQQIGSPSAFSMRSRSSGEESFVSVPESPTVGSLPESEQHSSDVLASTDDQTEDSKETVAEDTTASEISKTESLIDDNINNDEELVKNELAEKDFPEDNDEFGEFVSVPVEDPHLVTLAKPSEEENISKVAPETNNENEFNSLNKSAPLAAMDISEDESTAKGMILSPDEKGPE